jgi:predicted transcriptional regulator YdeE
MTQQSDVPQLVQFGPYRVIGARCAGKNENAEFSALWEHDFLPRMQEVVTPEGADFVVGLCRCLPGVTDGSFEYIAAAPATAAAPIPAGMIEAEIAAATYVVFPVSSLAEIMQAWGKIGPWLEAHADWEGYCGPAGCDCATYPSFELYPSTFAQDGKLFIYVPVRKKP